MKILRKICRKTYEIGKEMKITEKDVKWLNIRNWIVRRMERAYLLEWRTDLRVLLVCQNKKGQETRSKRGVSCSIKK